MFGDAEPTACYTYVTFKNSLTVTLMEGYLITLYTEIQLYLEFWF